MKRIIPLRRRIDDIDEQILHFLKQRVEVSKIIGKVKRELKIPIRDCLRENELCAHVLEKATKLGLNAKEVKAIYREIIAMSIHAQETSMA